MPFEDPLRQLAERNGVQQEFWDIFGKPHRTTPETNRAILTALGVDCASEQSLAQSVADQMKREWLRSLPPSLVVSENDEIGIPVRTAAGASSIELELRTEAGQTEKFAIDLSHLTPSDRAEIDGRQYVERIAKLPRKLPLGYHNLHADGVESKLIVTPDRAFLPGEGRRAGLGVTLYGLRSRHNWGVGDFRDLRDLIDWAVPALRIDFLALNPLHAIHNRRPYNNSPYLPNTTFYRNFIYIDVPAVAGYERVRGEFESAGGLAETERLRATPVVEYERVSALKLRALKCIFQTAPPPAECHDWIRGEGRLLRAYAVYCALDEHLHAKQPDLWIWPDWPEEFRDPANSAVQQFALEHDRDILFYGWLQWLIDTQIAQVQKHAHSAGMTIGLYHDLALATDRCGSDLWAHRPFYIDGCRVGSPPDDFSPTGQDWSFPPPNTARHREDGYCLYAESIRKSMRHGGALRIDHVMRLFRLYWIPEGHDATQGAYVRDRADDLVRILALESVRNRALIVGEDLGTVEDHVRETLARFGILSYRLLYFERKNGAFNPPGAYPAHALAASTTHDLPTITGFWTGSDVEARLKAGTIDQAAHEMQLRDRVQEKQRLLDALFQAGLLPDSYERAASRIPELTPELHYAIIGFLAGTNAMLWLVNQEDLSKQPLQQNLPGTTAEYPNWSHKMGWTIEELRELPVARDCAKMVLHWIERSGRILPSTTKD